MSAFNSNNNAAADKQQLPPRVAAIHAFFDGIPSSVSAQIAQLMSMSAIARLTTTNDYTTNGVVSSLVTTVIGLLISTLGSALRYVVVWVAGLTEQNDRKEEEKCDADDELQKMYRPILDKVIPENLIKLKYFNRVDYNKVHFASYYDPSQVQFQSTAILVSSAVKLMYDTRVSVEMSTNFSSAPNELSVSDPLLPAILRPADISGGAYAIVCLTRDQVHAAYSAVHAAAAPTAAFCDYLHSPVYFYSGKLYSQSLVSINHVMFTVYVAWCARSHEQKRADLRAAVRKIYDLEYKTVAFISSAERGRSPSGGGGTITYLLSDGVELGARYSMDSMYLESKSVLLGALDKFERGDMYPKGLAMTNKLGVLMYGPPGTGKTNTIRAMANRLGRGLLRIDCSKFVEFDEDAFCRIIRTHTNTCVIELDEFDHVLAAMDAQSAATEARERRARDLRAKCMMFNGGEDESSSEDGDGEPPAGDYSTTKRQSKKRGLLDELNSVFSGKKNGPRPITANFLLRWLDGLGQDDERVIVMCTNNPQMIPQDMLRAGRVDVKVYCGYCTPEMLAGLVGTKFPRDSNDWAVFCADACLQKLAARNIAPRNLINTLSEADDLGTFLELLEEYPQLPDYPHKHIFESDAQRMAKIRAATKRDERIAAAADAAADDVASLSCDGSICGDGDTSSSAVSTTGSE